MKDGAGEGTLGFMTPESTAIELASRRGNSDMNILQVQVEKEL